MKSTGKKSRQLQEIAHGFSLDIIYAFGSQAKPVAELFQDKDQTAQLLLLQGSDVDIAVKPHSKERLSVREKVNLTMALEDLFSVSRVDLVVLPEADPFLAANVVRGERLYERDKYLADEYELYILRKAGDLAALERERIAIILGEDQ